MQPVPGRFGRFFGDSSSPGVPVITPSRAAPTHPAGLPPDPPQPTGHQPPEEAAAADLPEGRPEEAPLLRGFDGCLGDVADVWVDVVSNLPEPLEAEQILLVISVMQVWRGSTPPQSIVRAELS